MNPVHTSYAVSLRHILILSYYLRLDLRPVCSLHVTFASFQCVLHALAHLTLLISSP